MSRTATITVNGVNKQVSYGQGSSTSTIASALATAIANDGSYPATASANGATVNLTARTAGTVGNGYALNASTTYNTSYFGGPSFSTSKSGNFLSGGVAGSIVYDTGTVTLTISGCTPFTVNYSNGSTRDSVAAALRSAVNASGPCAVTAGGSGTSISLTSDATGSAVNFALSTSGTTNYSQYFGSPSFSLATSGMSGGADAIPMSLTTPAITAYTYDVLDNLLCVEQRGNVSGTGCASAPANDATSPWRVRRFAYNSLSQLLEATNPESGAITYAYDSDGNLLTKTSPKPNQINPAATVAATYTYDALHRLTQKSFNDLLTPGVSYHYDQTSFNGLTIANGKGQRTGMTDASGATAWSFDITVGTGWKTTERRTLNSVTKTIITQNNLAGAITQLTYPSGQSAFYAYDAAGRPTTAQGSLLTLYAFGATYAPHGALATLANDSNIASTYFYNNRLQPCRMHVRTSGSAPTACGDTTTAVGNVLDFKYSFDSDPGAGVMNNGNVVQLENKRDPNRTQNFTYDELNRIRTATTQATTGTHAWGLTFGYDAWANLLAATVTQGSAPQLSLGAALTNRIAGYCYDAAGNLLIEAPCGGTANYTYDAENRITTTAGVTYTHDGDGKRVKKDQAGGTTHDRLYWTGGGSDALAESDLAGTISEEYIFFGGKRIARRIVATGVVFYYFADHLGTSRVILQAGATSPCFDADYYPFGGERTPVTNTCPQNYKFTGKERDTESGLDYFGARYYASTFGRYVSADWSAAPRPIPYADFLNPQTLNLFTYVLNNPVNGFDPDGHCDGFQACLEAVTQAALNVGQKIIQGLTTPVRHANGRLATSPHDINAAIAGNVAQSVVNATTDYATGDARQRFTSLSANEQMEVFAEGVFTGAVTVALFSGRQQTVTRYMGTAEAAEASATGRIPNVNADGSPKPIYVTTDPPLNGSGAAAQQYALPGGPPSYRATVPASQAPPRAPAPGGPTTSGGGSQAVINRPIPVKPDQIKPMKPDGVT